MQCHGGTRQPPGSPAWHGRVGIPVTGRVCPAVEKEGVMVGFPDPQLGGHNPPGSPPWHRHMDTPIAGALRQEKGEGVTGGWPGPHPGGSWSPPWHSPLDIPKTGCPPQHQAGPQWPTGLFWGAGSPPQHLLHPPGWIGRGPRTEQSWGQPWKTQPCHQGLEPAWSQSPVGTWTTPGWERRKSKTLRGMSQHGWFHFFPLSKSQGVQGGCLQHLLATGLRGVHPKTPGEPPPCPSQAHPHPQSGVMGLERGSPSLGDPKTSAHTAGTGPELPGEHGHRSHLPLPRAPTHTGTLCPRRVGQRWQCKVGGGTSPGPQGR